MYVSHWGMLRQPFADGERLEAWVPTEPVALALGKFRCALAAAWRVVVVTGPAGVGKSAILHSMLGEAARAGWTTAYFGNPALPLPEALELLARLVGAEEAEAREAPARAWTDRLRALAREHRRVCLVVDDAHALRDTALLECLRMALQNAEDGGAALHLLLGGQAELDRILAKASGFSSHVSLRIEVPPLEREDAKRYILYRLKEAGCSRGIFTRQAAERIYAISGGIPRRIHRLCELSLLTGYGLGVVKVTPDIVESAAENLGLRSAPLAPEPEPVDAMPFCAPEAAAGTGGTPAAAEVDILGSV